MVCSTLTLAHGSLSSPPDTHYSRLSEEERARFDSGDPSFAGETKGQLSLLVCFLHFLAPASCRPARSLRSALKTHEIADQQQQLAHGEPASTAACLRGSRIKRLPSAAGQASPADLPHGHRSSSSGSLRKPMGTAGRRRRRKIPNRRKAMIPTNGDPGWPVGCRPGRRPLPAGARGDRVSTEACRNGRRRRLPRRARRGRRNRGCKNRELRRRYPIGWRRPRVRGPRSR